MFFFQPRSLLRDTQPDGDTLALRYLTARLVIEVRF